MREKREIPAGSKSLMVALFSVALLFLESGCTTEKIADYQPAADPASEDKLQKSGIAVTLDPFVESARTGKYFDMDAAAHGIAILHVHITNETSNQTFLVEKKGFQLVPVGMGSGLTGTGANLDPGGGGQGLTTTAIVLYGLGSEVIGVGFGLAGAASLSHSSEIRRNFAEKEMPDETLSPGQSMEGFIYFSPVKKREDWSQTTIAKIDVQNIQTHQVTELTVPFSH
jgi:hypothetical protein